MNELRKILSDHLHSDQMVEDLLGLIEPAVQQERSAAAEAMRNTCRDIAYDVQQNADTEAETEIAGYIRAKINNIKIDTPDDGRG